MLAPLQLDNFFVEELRVRTHLGPPAPPGTDKTPHLDVDFTILRAARQHRFLVPLSVKVNHRRTDLERMGYALDLNMTGFFSFPDDVEEALIDQLISLNAPAMLYGIARGIAAQTLAMTRAGKVALPSVNFVELQNTRLRARRREKAVRGQPDESESVTRDSMS